MELVFLHTMNMMLIDSMENLVGGHDGVDHLQLNEDHVGGIVILDMMETLLLDSKKLFWWTGWI